MTSYGSGITKGYFDKYFKNCHTAHAIKIMDARQFAVPIDPEKVFENFHAPQNFMYTDIEI